MTQNKKHCMYAAACFCDLPSRSLITAWFKGVLKGRLHGVLPLHHNECCSKLQSPVHNKKRADEVDCDTEPIKKLLATKEARPNFTSLHFGEKCITVMATTTDKIPASSLLT
jgi:hypothetical protein